MFPAALVTAWPCPGQDNIVAEPAEYDLVMPFVTVTSAGGPHDDDAYVAGFEMGALDACLRRLRRRPLNPKRKHP